MQLKKFHLTLLIYVYNTVAAVNRTWIPTKLVKFHLDRRTRVRLINNNTIGVPAVSGVLRRFCSLRFRCARQSNNYILTSKPPRVRSCYNSFHADYIIITIIITCHFCVGRLNTYPDRFPE